MKLGDAFEYFDKRHDGVISFEEVGVGCWVDCSSATRC